MRGTRWSVLWLILALVLAVGCAGGDDDDNDDASGDDDTIAPGDDDDASPSDDDDDDDDNDDDDDDNDDDDNDDDDNDDDDNDDDTTPALDPPSYGWILMDTDRTHISWVIGQTSDFGIDNVQLSHGLIMDIDQINEDEAKAELLQGIAQEAHAEGLEVWVWAHEFYDESLSICFDPEDSIWERRKNAYRDALERIPEIDGVVLMFGSADMEPWYALCLCDWCADNEPTGNALLAMLYPRPADRARMVYDAVGQVVMGEAGKKLRMRTFLHQPLEVAWLRASLTEGDTDPGLMVMSKDVPQDWQPYYPHNPLIGDVGPRHQIIEMDLGNEYWGHNAILNGQVDYIYYRYTYDRAAGARGGAARIERGSAHSFGTPNEINIYAFSRLLQDENATPDQVYREWFTARYGIAGNSPAADTLKAIFRNSHYAMRKSYYTLGQWTLVKGSDVPDSARYPAQLWSRCAAFYDLDWLGRFGELVFPNATTLRELWQEGAESREIAADNLAALESIEPSFTDPDDYTELHDMLRLQVDMAEVWQLVAFTTFRFASEMFASPEEDEVLEWCARRLTELADQIEATWGVNVPLIAPSGIREFVADLREGVPALPNAEEYAPPLVADVEAEDLGGGEYRITWTSSEPTTGWVEWSRDLPIYDGVGEEVETASTEHAIQISVAESGRHVFRVRGHAADETLVQSGDFWFGLDP
jgi:hypothetical protein